jgi:outer membrane protein TolC
LQYYWTQKWIEAQAKQQFCEVYIAQQIVKKCQSYREQMKEAMQNIYLLYREGKIEEYTQQQTELYYLRSENEILSSQIEYQKKLSDLLIFLCRTNLPIEEISLEEVFFSSFGMEESDVLCPENNIRYWKILMEIKLRELQYHINRQSIYPKVSLFFNGDIYSDGYFTNWRPFWSVGISVEWPLGTTSSWNVSLSGQTSDFHSYSLSFSLSWTFDNDICGFSMVSKMNTDLSNSLIMSMGGNLNFPSQRSYQIAMREMDIEYTNTQKNLFIEKEKVKTEFLLKQQEIYDSYSNVLICSNEMELQRRYYYNIEKQYEVGKKNYLELMEAERRIHEAEINYLRALERYLSLKEQIKTEGLKQEWLYQNISSNILLKVLE